MELSASLGYRDFVWAVELHRKGLEIIGLWPKIDKSVKEGLWPKIRVCIILSLLIFVCNIPMLYAVVQTWGNMILVIDNLRTTLPMLIASVKYVIIRYKQAVLSSIISMMAEDWIKFKLDTERNVMIERARTSRLIMIIGYVFTIIGLITMTIFPFFGVQVGYVMNITGRSKMLPIKTYHFYDADKSPQFELTFFFQAVTCFFAAGSYMFIDILLLLMIFHICGQLENFRHQLIRLILCKNFNRTLNNITMTHSRLIRFADNIENTYSLMLLILVLHFGIEFCLSGFLFITVFNEEIDETAIGQVYYTSLILVILLMNTFFYCGAGELVIKQCEAVYHAVCDLEWYNLNSKKARNIILLMIRTSHPFRITAGKIVPLTMASFCSILKTSSGYITYLLAKYG
ncbi:hypothetical protein P5V15_003336 [Pogonomyrmex californicus]